MKALADSRRLASAMGDRLCGVVYPFPAYPPRPYVALRYDFAWEQYAVLMVGRDQAALETSSSDRDEATKAAQSLARDKGCSFVDVTPYQDINGLEPKENAA